jgi:hypothetical protein
MNAMPRVMIRHSADFVGDDKQALALLKSGYDVKSRVILSPPRFGRSENGDLPRQDGSSAAVVDYGINHKAFRVKMESEGYLVVNDVHYPGWMVRVDGEEKELLTANYLFQAVHLPMGNHQVVFEFRPLSFRAGLFISAVTLILLLAWSAVAWKRALSPWGRLTELFRWMKM